MSKSDFPNNLQKQLSASPSVSSLEQDNINNIYSLQGSPIPQQMDFSYPRIQNPPMMDDHLGLDYDRQSDRLHSYDPFGVSNEYLNISPQNSHFSQLDQNIGQPRMSNLSNYNINVNHYSQPSPTSTHSYIPNTQVEGSFPYADSFRHTENTNNYQNGSTNTSEKNSRPIKTEDDEQTYLAFSELYAPPKMKPRAKSAHNVIEQRYRNKINDRFTALQMLVPTLRVIARKQQKNRTGSVASREDDDDDDDEYPALPLDINEDLEGLEPARKLNKGTILTKSIEYIKFLERKNEKIRMEYQELIERARMMGLQVDDSLLEQAKFRRDA